MIDDGVEEEMEKHLAVELLLRHEHRISLIAASRQDASPVLARLLSYLPWENSARIEPLLITPSLFFHLAQIYNNKMCCSCVLSFIFIHSDSQRQKTLTIYNIYTHIHMMNDDDLLSSYLNHKINIFSCLLYQLETCGSRFTTCNIQTHIYHHHHHRHTSPSTQFWLVQFLCIPSQLQKTKINKTT